MTRRAASPGDPPPKDSTAGSDVNVAHGAEAVSEVVVERSLRSFYVPYAVTEWATVQAWLPMTEDDWDAMIAMLQVMKRGLVSAPVEVSPATGAVHGDSQDSVPPSAGVTSA